MKFYFGLTDQDWFDYLSNITNVDKVNFWQLSASSEFRVLSSGDFFLLNFIGASEIDNIIVRDMFTWWSKWYMKTGHKRLGRILVVMGRKQNQ